MYRKVLQLAIYTLLIFSCYSQHEDNKDLNAAIIPGAERTELYRKQLTSKNVGLVVNPTSQIGTSHLVDSLLKLGVQVSAIFAPEHGFRGRADAGEQVSDGYDNKTGLPIISLYGKNKKPTAEQLRDIDILVFDIQDVGVRFYTYISTLHYVMEAAAENAIKVLILDRPNPNRHIIDGPIMEPEFISFVGLHPVPILYGLTIGEYGRMINGEHWLKNGLKCDLEVIPCGNYGQHSRYSLPVRPSPNLPNDQAINLYPSLCFFEGTTFSIGRGTDAPFQVIGHPDLINYTFTFTPRSNEGSKYPKHENKACYGVDLRAIPQVHKLDLSFLLEFYNAAEKEGIPFFNDNNFFEKLAGTLSLRKALETGKTAPEIRASWQPGLNKYKLKRNRYLLYE
ncbi:MAG: DUF1343 domain-containing protein [Saprospiraceae bacterium]|nr:DUF1343 domain-containing protein [Saprospiraceae bacterium]